MAFLKEAIVCGNKNYAFMHPRYMRDVEMMPY